MRINVIFNQYLAESTPLSFEEVIDLCPMTLGTTGHELVSMMYEVVRTNQKPVDKQLA